MEKRVLQPELMDDPDLDAEVHRRALVGLARVNWWSRSANIFWPAIRRCAREAGSPIRVLDIASGGGDVSIAVAKRAEREGLDVEVDGFDISPVAVEYASAGSVRQAVSNVSFHPRDILHDEVVEKYDVVMCSLFLHHLSVDDALTLMRRMQEMATRKVLINDLRRTRVGYALAWCGCRLLTRSPIVHTDGPMSVAAAFSIPEVRDMASRAGLTDSKISTHWPQRFLLEWSRS